VGNLSAITVNTGDLTVSGTVSDASGNWSVDSSGNMIAKSWTLKDSSGTTVLAVGGQLNWSYVGGSAKPADNATVGAPSGTNVGSVSADTVASATNAVNDGTTGLNFRMRNNTVNVLSGGAGFTAGTLTYDATTGNRTGGYGVVMNKNGIAAYNSSGTNTFSLDATTGSASFSGTLSAATGTFAGSLSAVTGSFGGVTLASGGSFKSGQTAYNSGTGFFLGYSGSTPVLSIGQAGGSSLLWDGTNLYINSPVFVQLTATTSGTLYTTVSNGLVGYGGLTVNTSGGTPQSYTWSVSWYPEGSISASYSISGGQNTDTAYFQGNATNNRLDATITCTVTFTDGRTATAYRSHSVTHGTYNP
jgi:hypothetical protein